MKSKLSKLVATGPREVLFRIGRRLALYWERVGYKTGRFDWSPGVYRRRLCKYVTNRPAADDLPEWWQRHMQQRPEPPFLLSTPELGDAADLYRCLFSDRLGRVVDTAERVCKGEFSLLGIDFAAEDPIRWQNDPKTGRSWPAGFHADVEIFSGDVGSGDVKHVWELNRHEFLIDCAKAFLLTGESRYARRVFDLLQSWIASNPYLEGVNWASTLEVGARSLSWLWAYQFCRHWAGLTPDTHYELITSFYRHAAYLYRHLSFYFSPYNHLIGEATALYLLGCFFPEFDESAAWRRRGWAVLSSEVENQFHHDGGSVEQSTFYHNYCLGFFLLAALTRLRRGEPVPKAMLDRLEEALNHTMWMTTPQGTVPRIGDVDNARSIRFENPPLWDFRNLLSLGAVMFRREDMKAVAGSFSEDALWLTGREGYDTYQKLASEVPNVTSRAFPGSGYYIMRSGWGPEDQHFCFDCGPIAAGLHTNDVPSVAHGHADVLSFTASAFGKPLLVDGGFYTYDDPHWHRYFRETQAHNTIRLDRASQAKFTGPLGWSCVATPGPARWRSTEQFDFVEGSHAGFYGLGGRVRHRRAVFWRRNAYWFVLDRLEGQGEHDIEVFFHLAPGQAERLGPEKAALIHTNAGIAGLLQPVGDVNLEMEIIEGGSGPDGGWLGASYGVRERAPIVRFYGRLQLPVSLSFACIPLLDASDQVTIEPLRFTDSNAAAISDGIACRITLPAWDDVFAFSWDNTASKQADRCRFDGRLMAVRRQRGSLTELCTMDSSFLTVRESFELKLAARVEATTVCFGPQGPELRLSEPALYELSHA